MPTDRTHLWNLTGIDSIKSQSVPFVSEEKRISLTEVISVDWKVLPKLMTKKTCERQTGATGGVTDVRGVPRLMNNK